MAISTFTELKAAIATWAHRTDLTAVIPDFIALAESRINRSAFLHRLEQETNLLSVVDARTIALPSGLVEPKALWLTTYNDRLELRYRLPDLMPVYDDSGQPQYWTIDGATIAFDRPADQAYTWTLRYTGSFTLSDAAPTNWLLTNHPDVYLYASLLETAPYIRDMEQMQVWKAAYDLALMEVNDKEHRMKKLTTLSTELAMGNYSTIFEG